MFTEFQEEFQEVSRQFRDYYHEYLGSYKEFNRVRSEGRSEEEIKLYLERFLSMLEDVGGNFDI